MLLETRMGVPALRWHLCERRPLLTSRGTHTDAISSWYMSSPMPCLALVTQRPYATSESHDRIIFASTFASSRESVPRIATV